VVGPRLLGPSIAEVIRELVGLDDGRLFDAGVERYEA
jgi:hypothetical protein